MKKFVWLLLFLMFSSQAAKHKLFEFTLKNGLRVICIEKKTTPIVLFSIWYKCGSKCDAISKSGVAHYLEHMAFVSIKGMSKDFFENIGAEYNAFTSINTICFHEIVPKEHMETVFKYEAERMKSIQIDDQKFLGEKGAILEERSIRTDNDPDGAQQEVLLANIFNRKTGGTAVIGWKHEIESIKKQDLYAFHDKWFAPNNAIIVIVGDFDSTNIKVMSEKYFGNIKAKKIPQEQEENSMLSGTKQIKYSSPKTGSFSSIEYIYRVPFLSRGNFRKSLALELAIQAVNQPAFFVKKTLKHILNIASDVSFAYIDRMFQYDIVGVTIYCGSLEDLSDSIKAWRYLKNRLINVGISADELKTIKRKEMISLAYEKDDIEQMANNFGWLLACGYSSQEIQSQDDIIQSITLKECNDALREVFSLDQIAESKFVPKGYDRD